MNVRLFTESDRTVWDEYVRNHPNGTFFHLIGWKAVVEKSFGHEARYLVAENGKKVSGVFPLFSVKSMLVGRCMVSVPFATYGGILADNDNVANLRYVEAVDLNRRGGLDYLEMRSEKAGFGELPTKELYYVFKKEIVADHDKNFEAIPRKARRMVRLGIKNGLKARFGGLELLDPFYERFAANYRRLARPAAPSTPTRRPRRSTRKRAG